MKKPAKKIPSTDRPIKSGGLTIDSGRDDAKGSNAGRPINRQNTNTSSQYVTTIYGQGDDVERMKEEGRSGWRKARDEAKAKADADKKYKNMMDMHEEKHSGNRHLSSNLYNNAINAQAEWDEFTEGQISIPDLTGFDNVRVEKFDRNISPLQVILEKDVPNAIAGFTLGLPFSALPGAASYLIPIATGIAGSVLGDLTNQSLISSGPSESMEVIAHKNGRDDTVIYTADKYSEGGIDMQTTNITKGRSKPKIKYNYYPYDSFNGSEE